MRSNVSASRARILYAAAAVAIAAAPAAVFAHHPAPPRVLAGCNNVVDTTDSFSMNCAPTVIPDTSDQLTEAEVAEPGYNAVPGGADHGGGHGGR